MTAAARKEVPPAEPGLPPIRGRVQADAPLAPFTWFRAGGHAEILVRPADAADLATLLRALPATTPVQVIGAASNLIIRDGGLPGVTIRLARGFSTIAVEPDGLIAGAAALDLTVAETAAAAGLTGLEFLSGIPGTIGGAVAMNAGAYGGEMAHVLSWAECVTRDGERRRLSSTDLAFGYRHANVPPGSVITRVQAGSETGCDPGDRGKDGGYPGCAGSVATGSRTHRWVDVPQSGRRHESLGTDRRCRMPRPERRRRDGFGETLQFSDQHGHRDSRRHRGSG